MDKMFNIGEVVSYNSKEVISRTGEVIDVKINEQGEVIYLVDFGTSFGWLLEKYLEKF